MIEIIFNEIEFRNAVNVGTDRNVENLRIGRQLNRPNYDGWNFEEHIAGACGELAVCKAFNLPWTGMGVYRASDVGPLEVRTGKRHTHDLIVHPEDPDDALCVLVTGEIFTFRIHGWITGHHAKRKEWFVDRARNGRPAFFVPRSALLAPERLHKAQWIVSYPHDKVSDAKETRAA